MFEQRLIVEVSNNRYKTKGKAITGFDCQIRLYGKNAWQGECDIKEMKKRALYITPENGVYSFSFPVPEDTTIAEADIALFLADGTKVEDWQKMGKRGFPRNENACIFYKFDESGNGKKNILLLVVAALFLTFCSSPWWAQ